MAKRALFRRDADLRFLLELEGKELRILVAHIREKIDQVRG